MSAGAAALYQRALAARFDPDAPSLGEARGWLTEAATAGHWKAQRLLAAMLEGGLGGEVDLAGAYAWHARAAAQGDGAAAARAGLLGRMGHATPAVSRLWLELAAAADEPEAWLQLGVVVMDEGATADGLALLGQAAHRHEDAAFLLAEHRKPPSPRFEMIATRWGLGRPPDPVAPDALLVGGEVWARYALALRLVRDAVSWADREAMIGHFRWGAEHGHPASRRWMAMFDPAHAGDWLAAAGGAGTFPIAVDPLRAWLEPRAAKGEARAVRQLIRLEAAAEGD